MKFEISQALLIERTIVVSLTIVLFGFVSIGGLWLWRRAVERKIEIDSSPSEIPNIQALDALTPAVENLADALRTARQSSRERLTSLPQR